MGLRTMPCKRMLMHRTLNEGLGWLILMFTFKLSNSKCVSIYSMPPHSHNLMIELLCS